MTTVVTVASGKGGVGKSMLVANLGAALSRRGWRVVMADLDLGGSNLSALFGAFGQTLDLGRFLSREVESLSEVMTPIATGLHLLATTADSLAVANPTWNMKRRLLRHLSSVDAEIVLVDIGAGVGNDAMDFFRAGDVRILVSMPEPTATLDAYRFLKLATIREAASRVSSRDPRRRRLEWRKVRCVGELTEWRDATMEGDSTNVPWLVVNQADPDRDAGVRLRRVAREFLAEDLGILGSVPRDEAIRRSVSRFLPVVLNEPESPSARALARCATRLEGLLGESGAQRTVQGTTVERGPLARSRVGERPFR